MEVGGSWKRVLVALRATVACYDVDATENRVVTISMDIDARANDSSGPAVSVSCRMFNWPYLNENTQPRGLFVPG